jgi:NAD(P)-dependent dehydrogenase (short-subunit alcohol dehydrogenase family)
MAKWTSNNIPNLKEKTAIVTGGNTGLGFEMVLQITLKKAKVVIACRSVEKGKKALAKIETIVGYPTNIEVIPLDLTDYTSITNFCQVFIQKHQSLDILINNAGLVNLKNHTLSSDNQELQMATNHFGHFALVGQLLTPIKNAKNARIVTMSSGGHKWGNINFDDLNWTKRTYDRVKSYGDSKLANLMFVNALQDFFNRTNINATSVGAHPGLSATERQQSIGIGGWLTKLLAQPVWKGALPALMAATKKDIKPKTYYGPRFGMFGYPKQTEMDNKVYDLSVSEKLWKVSEQITQVKYEI